MFTYLVVSTKIFATLTMNFIPKIGHSRPQTKSLLNLLMVRLLLVSFKKSGPPARAFSAAVADEVNEKIYYYGGITYNGKNK
jgi:hypothetical protein